MDYETPDGSQFSLREIWTEQNGQPVFDYTSVSAYLDGVVYAGKLNRHLKDIDEEDALGSLMLVSEECIRPLFSSSFTLAPIQVPSSHYLKAPSFTYDDCRPGHTFVADCILNEVNTLEFLRQHPHPNIVSYLGCREKDGRITHLCLKRYQSNLVDYASRGLAEDQIIRILDGVKAGIRHLHSLGVAHNDINPENICVDERGRAVLVDFDGCLPFGEHLRKGVAAGNTGDPEIPLSSPENDEEGFEVLIEFLERALDIV